MFAEIINEAITTGAWAEIKPVGSFASCSIVAQARDGSSFKLSLTGSDAAPYWTVKENSGMNPGKIRLKAGTRIIYAKAISADCTVEIAVKRR
ncbi:MAG: hypothetical protein JEZ12_27160 [Desulfobacterium sp.]|nr:hypothetical protein [Desulfobacterium sp.]